VDVSIVAASDIRLQTAQKRGHQLAITVVWKVTYPVTAPWSKRQNLAIAVARRVIFRVIVPNLKAALAALEGPVVVVVVVVLARNAIAAARSATLRARAPKHPEVAQEATGVVAEGEEEEEEEEEATVALGAVKKHVIRAAG